MTEFRVGVAAMLSRMPPRAAVDLARRAEQHGFRGVMATDDFQPWTSRGGQAPFVWNVLTAIAETTAHHVGPGVVCPSFRLHPAVVAQASATLAALYPGRHWLGIGAGEALNEHVVGGYWPEAPERINRMFEAIDVIRKLFAASLAGRDVKHAGPFFRLESSRLWTMPASAPPIYVATAGPVTAKRAGRTVDGLITQGAPFDKVAGLFGKFDEGAREAGKDPARMPKVLQLHLSWAPIEEEARANALAEWPIGAMTFSKADIRSPSEFEQLARLVRAEDFAGNVVISADPDVHRAAIQRFLDLGVTEVYLHNASPDQETWLEVFGREVLPKLRR